MKLGSVTAIIPTRNRATVTLRAIGSILTQEEVSAEIVVVDDCSDDDSLAMLQGAYGSNPRVRIVALPQRGGAAAARNIGIRAADTDFVSFLDSDDTWCPRKLITQLRALEGRSNAFASCATLVFRHSYTERQPITLPTSGESPLSYIIRRDGRLQTSTLLVPTIAAQELLFDESLPMHQDYDFVQRLWQHGLQVVFINEPLCGRYVDRGDRISYLRNQSEPFLSKWAESLRPDERLAFLLMHCPGASRMGFNQLDVAMFGLRHGRIKRVLLYVIRTLFPGGGAMFIERLVVNTLVMVTGRKRGAEGQTSVTTSSRVE